MNIPNKIGAYLLGAATGILLVVGCGGGNGGNAVVNSAGATTIAGVTAQLVCFGPAEFMVGTVSTGTANGFIYCQSSTSPTTQNFHNFNQIAQQGWILVEINPNANTGSNLYLFHK